MPGFGAGGLVSAGKPDLGKLCIAGQRVIRATGLRGAVGIEELAMHATIRPLVGFAKAPWNKGRLTGQKRPLSPKEVWAIRVRLQLDGEVATSCFSTLPSIAS